MSEQEFYFKLDSAGFPLIGIPHLRAYVHFLPITKIQIEYFVSATNDAAYDESWYNTLLSYSPRVSPGQIRAGDWVNLFATGILPREAQRFALWCGREYTLPISHEWQAIFQFAQNQPAISGLVIYLNAHFKLNPRARVMLETLERVAPARSLAEQMRLSNGVMEYVYEDNQQNSFGGHGNRGELINPLELQRLANSREGARIKQFGFRLMMKE